jgi:hypothetical protein
VERSSVEFGFWLGERAMEIGAVEKWEETESGMIDTELQT